MPVCQVKGNVYVVYNMGTRDYPIGEVFEHVSDGRYHVVRFTRAGPNSTIQVDNLMMQTKMPRGEPLSCIPSPLCVRWEGQRSDLAHSRPI